MKINVQVEVPFARCERCAIIDIKQRRFFADGKLQGSRYSCANSENCRMLASLAGIQELRELEGAGVLDQKPSGRINDLSFMGEEGVRDGE